MNAKRKRRGSLSMPDTQDLVSTGGIGLAARDVAPSTVTWPESSGRHRIRFTYTYLGERHGGSQRSQSTMAARTLAPGQQVTVPIGSVIPNSSRACKATSALPFTLVSEKSHDLRTIS
jgi:hypothetical protein